MKRVIKRFLSEERGSVLILLGLGIIFMVGIGGAGVDLGVQQLMRVRMQTAADAAVTSAASLELDDNIGAILSTDVENAAIRYFNLNFPRSYYGGVRSLPVVQYGNNSVRVSSSGSVPTSFVSNFGISSLTVNVTALAGLSSTAASDYDVVMVVDESGSTARCLDLSINCGLPTYSAPSHPNSLMTAMQNALRTMATNIIPVNNSNPNVRIGVVGYTSFISNKWGPSSRNADVLAAINQLRPITENYDHWGLEAGLNMITGGSASATNGSVLETYNEPLRGYIGPCRSCTYTRPPKPSMVVPSPRTPRTNPSDANGMSNLKYVVMITDGALMEEPIASEAPPCPEGGGITAPCYSSFVAQCQQAKNSSHLFVINFAETLDPQRIATMIQCASPTIAGGATFSGLVKPDPTKDYFFAPGPADLNNILSNITTQIKSVRIQE